jgi:hypothetical protein
MAFADPTAAYTAADLAAMIDEKWSSMVLEPNFAKSVASNFFTNLSEFVSESGDIVRVPNIYTNLFTASTQSTQGNAVVDQSPAQVDVTLTINLHKYVAWIIGDKDMKQLIKSYSLNQKYMDEAKNVLVTALEASLFGLWSSLSTNTVGDTATVLSDAEIVQAIELLDALNFDVLNKGAFFFHPFVYWRQVATIAKYYTSNISQLPIIRDGNFGTLDSSKGLRGQVYGIPIFVSTNIVNGLSTYRNLLAMPEAFGFAVQTQSNGGLVRSQVAYLLQNLGTLAVCDIIYGVAVLREDAGVLINANDTAITS